MNILSIDIGIKNLAFCLFKYENKQKIKTKTPEIQILDWDILNLSKEIVQKCNYIDKKKNKQCNFNACFMKTYKDNNEEKIIYYCKKHSGKDIRYITPDKELINFIKKQTKINKEILISLYNKYIHPTNDIHNYTKNNTKFLKKYYIDKLNNYIEKNCYIPIIKENASNLSLIDIGINMNTIMQEKFKYWIDNFNKIDKILIENQIGIKAIRMKSIQGMLSMFFIMKNNNNIEYISSINKLKILNIKDNIKLKQNDICILNEKKTTYKERKKTGIDITKKILKTNQISLFETSNFTTNNINNTKNMKNISIFFEKHKKQDDLCDTLLQGLWYINEYIDNNYYNKIIKLI